MAVVRRRRDGLPAHQADDADGGVIAPLRSRRDLALAPASTQHCEMDEFEFAMQFAQQAEQRATGYEGMITQPSLDPRSTEAREWFPAVVEDELLRLCRLAANASWLRASGSSYRLSFAAVDRYIDRRWPGIRARARAEADAAGINDASQSIDAEQSLAEIGERLGAPGWAVGFVAVPWLRDKWM